MDVQEHGFDILLTLQGEQICWRYRYGAGSITEEPVHVPATPTALEGSGWVLGTARHWPSERTTLSMFDAQAVNAGPLASVTLPDGLPLGLHG